MQRTNSLRNKQGKTRNITKPIFKAFQSHIVLFLFKPGRGYFFNVLNYLIQILDYSNIYIYSMKIIRISLYLRFASSTS